MATSLIDKARDVIPRWRDFRTTVAIGELKSASGSQRLVIEFPNGDFLRSKLRDWSRHRDIAHAADLIGAAFVLGRQREVEEAAAFLLKQDEHVPSTAKSIAYQILNPISDDERLSLIAKTQRLDRNDIITRIHRLRQRLKDEPRNTIAYVDLSRLYTLLDQRRSAERAIDTALRLDSSNRFVLRSAARFFVHCNDSERAHQELRRAEASKTDPWLMAAEVAVASAHERPSRFALRGQGIISDKNYSPADVTELASAIATLELKSGKSRDARKLFKKALIAPTENSIAQVEWASRRISGLDEIRVSQFDSVPRIYEAKAWEHYTDGNWSAALSEAWNWLFDQPFSRRPSGFGSYLAHTVIGDYLEAIKILKLGRIANPDDPMLLNDLAFSYASSDRLHDAQKAFGQIDMSKVKGEKLVVVTATKGLLAFRAGKVLEGRSLYLEAIELASEYNQRYKAMAAIYLAREEMRANTIEATKAREIALELSHKLKEADVQAVVDRELALEKANAHR
jgi:tetratricopeptide (TPR) repeat protein